MNHVPVRELNQHTAAVLARVAAGERVGITRNGVAVAVIEPVGADPLAALAASGDLRPATRSWRDIPFDDDAVQGSPGVEAVEEDRRGADRW